jgi:surfeit locus 1 family protein
MLKKQSILTQTARQNKIAVVPLVAALVVAITTAMLGSWRNQAEAGVPVKISGTSTDVSALASKKISVRGTFENDRTVYIDNRSYQGKAGLHVVTPLLIEGSNQRIAVLRGWVERNAQDRNRLPDIPALYDTLEISGLAQSTLGKSLDLAHLSYVDPAQMAVPASTERLWPQFDPKPYGKWLGADVLPITLRQFSNTNDGLIRDWSRPTDEVAKHHGYAVQWFALSGLTVVLWFYYVVIRPRRLMRLQASERAL